MGLSAVAPQLREAFDLSLGEVGLVLAAESVGGVATLLLWGYAADRVGERAAVGVGLGACGGALALASAADGFLPLFLLLVAAGALGGAVNTASGRAVMGWFPAKERGLALGIRQTSVPIGGAVAALVLPHLGARDALLAVGAATILGAAAGALLLRAPRHAGHEPEPAVPWTLRDARLWTLSGSSALMVVAQVSLVGFVVLYLHDTRGVSTTAAAGVLAGIQVLGVVLRIGTGIWSDRVGSRIGPFRRVALAVAVALGAATALAGAPLWLLVPALLVAGGLSMGWNTLSFAAAAELGGRARAGAAIGVQQTSLAVALAAASPLFAVAVAATSWEVAYALAALFPVAAFLLLARLS